MGLFKPGWQISSPAGLHHTSQFVDDLRRFLGLARYYRKFVSNFASTASPLYQLLKKNRSFVWTRECDLAFQAIKQVLQSDTLLKFKDLENPFILQTDASGSEIGLWNHQTNQIWG